MSGDPDSSYARAILYTAHGWSLCAVHPSSKKAKGDEWQSRARSAEHWRVHPNDGMGLVHGLSGTCSLDLDDPERAEIALRAVGVELSDLLSAPGAVRLIGAPGRGKLLYRAPDGIEISRQALNWPDPGTGKQGAVLELRGGSVMDVLPPSIHPGTGEPYRWEGDWRDLPELPADLLDVWTDWPSAKRAMEAACPWQDRPELAADRYANVERKQYGEGESVIAAFNDAHDPRRILESRGYRRAGPRMISPHSSSGDPGVVFLPGSEGRLVYVHHASDPLCDGHSHDAFSVWLHVAVEEHGGDLHRAVRLAAEMLGMDHTRHDSEDARRGAAIAARLMTPKAPEPLVRLKDEPAEPWTIPPIPVMVLADFERWLRLRNHGAKRVATTQGALAFAAAMATRRYVTSDRQPLNVLLGVVDSSIAGLRPIRGALYEAAASSGERQIIRGAKVTSDSSIHRALFRSPRMLWVSDDYGYMVAMARRQPSGALESALACIQEAYSGYAIYLDPDAMPGAKKNMPLSDCTIQSPGIAMLALVAENQMRDVTRRAEYGRGAVQQILFARADDSPDEDAGNAPGAPVPASVTERMRLLQSIESRALGGLNALATHPPTPAIVELGPGAADALEEVRAGLRLIFHDGDLARWRGVAHGAMTTVRRLAAVLGAWADPEAPVVTADIVRWVGGWVTHHAARSVEWYEAISSDDGEPDLISDIRAILWKAGKKGITSREIARGCRAYRRLSLEDRRKTMESMMEDRLCGLGEGRGERYVDRTFLEHATDPADAT